MSSEQQLYTELGSLRKGWGVRHPRVRDRIGPELRSLCAIDESTTHAEARTRIVELLTRAIAVMPDELALAARVMAGLDLEWEARTLTARQLVLAASWRVDHMTVRRRCDLALRRLSELLADKGADFIGLVPPEEEIFQSAHWYARSSEAVVRLDGASPEADEVRTVVALHDGLSGVTLGLGTPRARGEDRARLGLDVEVRYGGELTLVKQVTAAYFIYRLRFPRPLARGDEHTFGVRIRIPVGQSMAPHYISRPAHRVDVMQLRIKFDRGRLPRAVWRIDGVPFPIGEDDGPNGDMIAVDRIGEVHTRFANLRPRFGYGVCWLP